MFNLPETPIEPKLKFLRFHAVYVSVKINVKFFIVH